jgi:hypothetical protein
VTLLRRLLTRSPRLALVLVAMVLATRLLVPAGFMVSAGHGAALIACPGVAPAAAEAHRGHHAHRDSPAPHQAADQPCAFAALAAPVLVALAVALLAAVPLRAIATAPPRPAARALRAPPRWRPPLRAPPALTAR